MLTLVPHQPTITEREIKRSRFIGFAQRADSQEAARDIIRERRAAYPDARHHCSAFRIDDPLRGEQRHSSDDGEPSGTAGKPMLNALEHSGVCNVVVVVTRYFGGTLLGTGGLVRAYSAATADTIDAAPKVQLTTVGLYAAELPLEIGGRFEAELRSNGYLITDSHWSDKLHLTVATDDPSDLNDRLAASTRSSAWFHKVGIRTVEVPVKR